MSFVPLRVSAGLVGVAALLAAPAAADAPSDALLKKVAARTRATATLRARVTLKSTQPGSGLLIGTVALQRPNRARITLKGPVDQTIVSDGKTLWQTMPGNQFLTSAAARDGKNINALWGMPIAYFFTQKAGLGSSLSRGAYTSQYLGKEVVGKVAYDVVELRAEKPVAHTVRLFVRPDGLLTRSVLTITQGGDRNVYEATLSDVEVGKRIAAATFRYAPPRGAKRFQPNNAPPVDFEKTLLAVGAAAPEFTLPTPTGGKLTLSEARAGKKAVIVNFWFHACGPCRAEFPHLQKLYAELKDKGVELIAIDNGDDDKTINDYLRKEGFTFKVVKGTDETFKKYGVQAYPTNYVLDSEGKVVWRRIDFDEAGLRAALKQLGVE